MRLYYRNALEKAGFEVEQAINGIEAMEKVLAQAFRPSDRRRQHAEDGWLFLSSHASTRRGRGCGASRLGHLNRGRPSKISSDARIAGANFYLVKPVSEADLIRHVAVLTGAPA